MTEPLHDAAVPDAPPVRHLKPVKGPFMFPRLVGAGVVLAILATGLSGGLFAAGLGPATLAAGPLLFALGMGIAVYAAQVAYRKERYEIHPETLVARSGGIFSDQTTELDVKNITHVKQRLPWLRYKLFGVGDVLVDSAGIGSDVVLLHSSPDPMGLYADISALMQRNGYSLQRTQLLHMEQPDLVGVIVECLSMVAATALAVLLFLARIGVDVLKPGVHSHWLLPALLGGGPLVALLASLPLVFHFLDMRRRTYRVFEDVVVYEEGFLTRDNAFIPYENLANSTTKRSLVDQVLGLYDVIVSCQGSSADIKFRRLRNGAALSAVVENLVAASGEQAKRRAAVASAAKAERAAAAEAAEAASLGLPTPPPREPELVPEEDAWTAELTMHKGRALLPLLLALPFPPVWGHILKAAVRPFATRFSVRPSSIKSVYSFLATNQREFAYDKVTGLVVRTTPLDHLFDTVTVRVWSIGSPQPLNLSHIVRDQIDLDALRRQVGIPAASPEPYAVTTAFGLGAAFRANPAWAIFLALCVAGLVVCGVLVHPAFYAGLVPLAGLVLGSLLYSHARYARQELSFHPDHVEAKTGLLIRQQFLARHANVKKARLSRYPGGDLGDVQLFVAGEHRISNQTKLGEPGTTQTGARIPYAFTVRYVAGMEEKSRLIDDLLLARVQAAPGARAAEPLPLLREARRAAANNLTVLIGVSLLATPLVVLLPVTLPLVLVAMRRYRYRVEGGRVLSRWGIYFDHQLSVLFIQIDTLRHGQGALNKAFKNGKVSLMTAGSSAPDLVMPDMPSFEAFYAEIRPHYGKREA